MQYVTSVERFAIEKGKEEGREVSLRLLLRLLTHRFGQIPPSWRERVQGLTLAQAETMVDAVLASQSLAEFAEQLPPVNQDTTSDS